MASDKSPRYGTGVRAKVTTLLVFSRCTEAHVETLNALMDHMTGLAGSADAEGLTLHFDYWQSDEGAIAARGFQLEPQGRGLYRASAKLSPIVSQESPRNVAEPEPQLPVRPETPAYYCMDPDTVARAPDAWQLAPSRHTGWNVARNSKCTLCGVHPQFWSRHIFAPASRNPHTLLHDTGAPCQDHCSEKDASPAIPK